MTKKHYMKFILLVLSVMIFAGGASAQTVKEHFQRAMAASKAGNYPLAIAEYTAALQIDPKFHWAYYNRAHDHVRNGSNELAILDYTKAIEVKPDYAAAYNNRADLHLVREEFDKAFADASKAIELDPNLPQPYLLRGNVYAKRRMNAEALADYKRSSQLDPVNPKIYFNLGIIYFRTEDWKAAIADWNRALALDPKLVDLHHQIMWANLLAGDHEQVPLAAARYIKANSGDDTRTKWTSTIAYLALLRAGKRTEAENFLKEYPGKDLSNSNASRVLDLLRGKMKPKGLIDAQGGDNRRLQQAYTYIGESELIKGNTAAAIENFRAAEKFNIATDYEHKLAVIELKRLSGSK